MNFIEYLELEKARTIYGMTIYFLFMAVVYVGYFVAKAFFWQSEKECEFEKLKKEIEERKRNGS